MSDPGKKITVPEIQQEKEGQVLQRSSYTGKTPKQLMNKHIRDKNDVITDDDFKNLNISIDISDDTTPPPLEIPADHERPKDEDKDPAVITSWNLIS